MGFRFHRSVRIIPGIRLNFSKSGVSTSIGRNGATVNLSKKGTRTTVGIPGSGLSYSTLTPHAARPANLVGGTPAPSSGAGWVVGIGAVLILGLIGLFAASPPGAPTARPATVAPIATSYVTALALNCRSIAGPAGSIVRTLDKGAAVRATATTNGWSKVSSAGAGDCWALSQFLSPDAPTSPATDASPLVGTVGSRHHARNLPLLGGAVLGTYGAHHHRISHKSHQTLDGGCPCGVGGVCIGPRGGRYCITSGGNKRYGV